MLGRLEDPECFDCVSSTFRDEQRWLAVEVDKFTFLAAIVFIFSQLAYFLMTRMLRYILRKAFRCFLKYLIGLSIGALINMHFFLLNRIHSGVSVTNLASRVSRRFRAMQFRACYCIRKLRRKILDVTRRVKRCLVYFKICKYLFYICRHFYNANNKRINNKEIIKKQHLFY